MSTAHVGFQVRQHNPLRIWLGAGLLLVLLMIMFLVGRTYQSFELNQLRLQQEVMKDRIAELEQRTFSLVQENAQLKGISKIEHDAYELAKQSEVLLQKNLLELKEQLVFYQGIVSPEQMALGVNLQTFELIKKNDLGLFGYKVVLSKRGKSDKYVKGDFDISISGQQNEEPIEFSLAQLKKNYVESDVDFSFRYFQMFEGDLQLPIEFEPFDIQLTVNPKTRSIKPFTESISWTQAISGGSN
jgi:hypothetical protein